MILGVYYKKMTGKRDMSGRKLEVVALVYTREESLGCNEARNSGGGLQRRRREGLIGFS